MHIRNFAIAALAGTALISPPAHTQANAQANSLEFGDNSSTWANDGECDDPRFEGTGMASTLLEDDRLRDANDCRELYQRGDVRLRRSVNFGDNSSTWANDGECDDPRFRGSGMASTLSDEHRLRDANDCRSLYETGRIQLVTASSSFNFGDDTSSWANDGECDDPRFEGPGTANVLLEADRFRDGTDCRSLYNSGQVQLRSNYVDFGDNTSMWADDGECDDPRFIGSGMASTLVDSDLLSDANDCRALYNAGQIRLR